MRDKMIATNQPLDSVTRIKALKAFSTTRDYASRVINMMSKIEKELSSAV